MKNKYSIYVYIDSKPKKTSGNMEALGLVVDDYPLLKSLIPVGTNVKKRYKEALTKAFVDEMYRPAILQIFERLYKQNEINAKLPDTKHLSYSICCRRPFGQNSMMAIAEFIEENMNWYIDYFKETNKVENINGVGSEWIDGAETSEIEEDGVVVEPTNVSIPSGTFKDTL